MSIGPVQPGAPDPAPSHLSIDQIGAKIKDLLLDMLEHPEKEAEDRNKIQELTNQLPSERQIRWLKDNAQFVFSKGHSIDEQREAIAKSLYQYLPPYLAMDAKEKLEECLESGRISDFVSAFKSLDILKH